jgi:bifunctional non-homologous end joining protein LigD
MSNGGSCNGGLALSLIPCPARKKVPRWNNLSRVVPAPGFIAPCLPPDAASVPDGPQSIHEIKHDGYRLLVRKRDGKFRIYTRCGVDWTKRFPRIVEAAMKPRATSLYLDGEGVVCGKDGIAVFDKLHSKANDEAVFLYAFDVVELNGVDMREASLEDRKRRLERMLRKSRDGIVFN